MKKSLFIVYWSVLLLVICGCSKEIAPGVTLQPNCGTDAALAGCLSPVFPPEYYIEQGVKYFQTMQSDIPTDVQPNYSDLVIRWEWPPWLLLTGYKRNGLITSDILLKLIPTAYDTIDCRAFDTQPFCRCHVIFNYSGEPCPIYEEFTFNDQGEITFIEAWSDFESLLPMGPGEDGIWQEDEYWGSQDVVRLSQKVPGLGNTNGKIDLKADWMKAAVKNDADIAEMVRRLKDPVPSWFDELLKQEKDGCIAPEGDIFPYYNP